MSLAIAVCSSNPFHSVRTQLTPYHHPSTATQHIACKLQKVTNKASQMAQLEEALVTITDGLNSIPGTYMVEG